MTPKQLIKLEGIFNTAHHDFEKGLNARAFFKVSNHELGEDLVQNTFIKTWAYMVRGGKIETMKAFLYHILNNLIIDEYRKKKATSLDNLLEKGFEPTATESGRMVDILEGKAVFQLIKRLPEKYQKIMLMRFTEEMTLQEISLVTGETRNTIAVQVHRGLERLKLLYEPT